MVGTASTKLVPMVGTATRTRSLCQWLIRRQEPEACDNGWYGLYEDCDNGWYGLYEACANGWYGDQTQKLVPMVGTAIRTRSL